MRPAPEEYLNSSSEKVRSGVLAVALLAGYAVLAIAHTYPLVLQLGTHLPGQGIGDNASFVWNLWWMREALASSSVSFFNNPMIEAPLGASLILHTHTALAAFVGATRLRRSPWSRRRTSCSLPRSRSTGWPHMPCREPPTRHAGRPFSPARSSSSRLPSPRG